LSRNSKRRVTQADVARLAGVNQSTVSHVLRPDADRPRVSDEVRQRVLDAIQQTGYAADPIAQRLARGRNDIIGVFTYEAVFPHGSRDFYHPFLLGIEAEAEVLGCDLLLFTSSPVVSGRRHLFKDGWNRLSITDGCLLLGRHVDRGELSKLIESDTPFVFIGRRETDAGVPPYVSADYVVATAHVVRMMLDHGHQRIGFLGDLGPTEPYQDRMQGYREAMAAAQLRPLILDHTDMTASDAVDLVEANRLTALLVGFGHLAEEIRVEAGRRRLNVPDDLSLAVLGQPEQPLTDDIAWSGFRIPREEMGAEALRLLSALIAGTSRADLDVARVLPCTYDVGETIAPARPRGRSTNKER
jgi:LacI family transcriptional regulator